MKNMLLSGYAGRMGYASAGALTDFIVVNMVAEAASGSKTPKEAAERRKSVPSVTTGIRKDRLYDPALQQAVLESEPCVGEVS